jgi:hypothetical protein
MVASHSIERKAKNYLTRRIKDDGPDTCNDTHDQRQAKQTGLGPETPTSKFEKLREPAKRMRRNGGL